jgi:hypothetical protein
VVAIGHQSLNFGFTASLTVRRCGGEADSRRLTPGEVPVLWVCTLDMKLPCKEVITEMTCMRGRVGFRSKLLGASCQLQTSLRCRLVASDFEGDRQSGERLLLPHESGARTVLFFISTALQIRYFNNTILSSTALPN